MCVGACWPCSAAAGSAWGTISLVAGVAEGAGDSSVAAHALVFSSLVQWHLELAVDAANQAFRTFKLFVHLQLLWGQFNAAHALGLIQSRRRVNEPR
jgi:hypothetical protein